MEAKKRRGVNIPHDIVEEILVKVPVKSLVRFKAVSKEWRGTIESKLFVDKHTRSQKYLAEGQARIVRVISLYGRTIRKRLPLENLVFMPTNGIVHSSPYRLIRHLRLPPQGYKICEPCDGLFCIYTSDCEFSLVNPATTSRRILPDPDPVHDPFDATLPCTLVGIGRENTVSPRYKLVWFFQGHKEVVNDTARCKVFALDTNTWRDVDPPNCPVYYDQPIIHLDGVLYCFSFEMKESFIVPDYNKQYDVKLLAFDLSTETFQSFSVTPDIGFTTIHELSICVLNHRLCIFRKRRFINRNDLFFNIWGLDINKRSWEIMFSIELSCFPEFESKIIIPVASINNYVILSNVSRTIWVLFGSKTHILRSNFSYGKYFMSFYETLVSVYQ
ncbi:putative F-box protein At2g02030 [Arabidopsis lyrata subsp. lyrata]|uniref:putative F-box protein At2g02030 n=1 Tax=Arabidopsis lyrata subsp. lyrata TaxID=81972 RepID=UPI000A29BEF4|nr:putative F-box protein At2g02030 [Arabidopsis lyrata subsp. lyrata]|eukprot:XP_020866262.1 putative F-box protein At2g02030 [Arabidopsis lyrata subsp. lyrata]